MGIFLILGNAGFISSTVGSRKVLKVVMGGAAGVSWGSRLVLFLGSMRGMIRVSKIFTAV